MKGLTSAGSPRSIRLSMVFLIGMMEQWPGRTCGQKICLASRKQCWNTSMAMFSRHLLIARE